MTPALDSRPVRSIGVARADVGLTERYPVIYPSLVRLACLLVDSTSDAEEIVQDAFVKAIKAMDEGKQVDEWDLYIRRIVLNSSKNWVRRLSVFRRHAPGLMIRDSVSDQARQVVERDAVVIAIRKLPARQRQAIVLRFYLDMSELDIANEMRMSVGSVKSAVSRAMDKLEIELKEEN